MKTTAVNLKYTYIYIHTRILYIFYIINVFVRVPYAHICINYEIPVIRMHMRIIFKLFTCARANMKKEVVIKILNKTFFLVKKKT